jgi:polar amino acid transport system substrate-binding protein
MTLIPKHVLLAALAAFATLPSVASAQTAPLTVYCIDAPPQGSAADGHGIMADAAMEALKRAGLTGKLEFVPWGRAQADVQAGKDLLITALARIPEREPKYTWLFPVFTLGRGFATTGKTISSFAEAKANLKQIAVAIGSSQHEMLIREGFSPDQLIVQTIEKQSVIPKMLLLGRADAWFSTIPEIKYGLKGNPDASKFVIGPQVGETTQQYLACSKDCSPELVAKLKKAGEEMKADGTMDAIVARYQ